VKDRTRDFKFASGAWAGGWFYWPVLVVGCTLVALATLGPEAERRLSVGRQCARMQAEVNVLKETEAQLEAAAEALRRDPAYMERVARHELGIARPGEIRLPQPVTLNSEARGEPAPAEPAPALALRVLELSAGRTVRLAVLGAGGALLATALLFGLSASKRSPA